MILAVGIDIVDISRFAAWHNYHPTTLRKIFTNHEIEYCKENKLKSGQRFAVRFAAKEACYKAIYQIYSHQTPPFITVVRSSHVHFKADKSPYLEIDWPAIGLAPLHSTLSLSHTSTFGAAYVLLWKAN